MTRKPPVVVFLKSAPKTAPQERLPPERNDSAPKQKPNPVAVAQFWLGNRLEERNGCFVLDGVPPRLEVVMRETNRLLQASGADIIDMNPRWVP